MHASNCEVVVVIMGQSYTTDQHSYHTTHIEKLSNHIAHDAEDIGEGYLRDFAFD